ncbi:MAG: hypothetical protein EOP83_19960 [Verrucomicrobiaceae bacterium]|nr:MAG: hypothetical protein EOP83_19960 [Verrucomicrobiaceae bacterium]
MSVIGVFQSMVRRFRPRLVQNPPRPKLTYPHEVRVPMTLGNAPGRHSVTSQDCYEWCETNLRRRYCVESDYGSPDMWPEDSEGIIPCYVFRFSDLNDAFAFKLKWA